MNGAAGVWVFETARLRCRRWVSADVEPLYAVYSDPEAMRFVGDGRPISRAECEAWLAVTEANYAGRGYGMFALEENRGRDGAPSGERGSDAQAVVGFCGLVHPGGQDTPEIKYALARSHWGRGLASEVVPALITYGARVHAMQHIIATVAPGNLASQRVLAKAGLSLEERRANNDGSTTLVFGWRCA